VPSPHAAPARHPYGEPRLRAAQGSDVLEAISIGGIPPEEVGNTISFLEENAMTSEARWFAAMVSVALIGCQREASTALDVESIKLSHVTGGEEWNVPVHLGAEVNSPFRELGAAISPDGLSLYYNSDRPPPEGLGSFDIYVSRRACLECPWEQARNLGPPINGPDNGGSASLSHDGHLLFFLSDRDELGNEDLWVSRRKNPNDDFGWEAPVNLGPLVNTAVDEGSPSYVVAAPGGHAELYFARDLTVWVAPISRHGEVLGPAVAVDLGGDARSASVRKDGREMVFWANARSGGLGLTDIWTSTRHNVTDSWSAPVNLGPPVNTAVGGELEAAISADGNTLVFSGTATRGSSLGLQDIWIATRVHRPEAP
jgi:hypothetical protein